MNSVNLERESENLIKEIKNCQECAGKLPYGPRPLFQFSSTSKILLIGQAPGIKAHNSGVPWNDKSGERLREWLNVSEETFYDPNKFAIVPMGLCYPGRGKSGDLPPLKECAPKWLETIRRSLPQVKIEIYVGKYACSYHFGNKLKLTELIQNQFREEKNKIILPHPSPRNNIWLAKNRWFEKETIPKLREKFIAIMDE